MGLFAISLRQNLTRQTSDDSSYHLSLLAKAKHLSEAKSDLAVLIARWLDALHGRTLVDKMFAELLENELLMFQITRFNKSLRDLTTRYHSFLEWNRIFKDKIYVKGVPFEQAIENLNLSSQ